MYRNEEQRNFARELRNSPTPAEKRLWHFLCAEKLGVMFRRQAAIGEYVVDFVCFPRNLIVELDGPQSVEDEGRRRDAVRTEWLAARGFRVVRFRNQELDHNIHGVVEEIKRAMEAAPLPNPPRRGEGADPGSEGSERSLLPSGGNENHSSFKPLTRGRLMSMCRRSWRRFLKTLASPFAHRRGLAKRHACRRRY
jgi:very-short-patch-repair endonuclease